MSSRPLISPARVIRANVTQRGLSYEDRPLNETKSILSRSQLTNQSQQCLTRAQHTYESRWRPQFGIKFARNNSQAEAAFLQQRQTVMAQPQSTRRRLPWDNTMKAAQEVDDDAGYGDFEVTEDLQMVVKIAELEQQIAGMDNHVASLETEATACREQSKDLRLQLQKLQQSSASNGLTSASTAQQPRNRMNITSSRQYSTQSPFVFSGQSTSESTMRTGPSNFTFSSNKDNSIPFSNVLSCAADQRTQVREPQKQRQSIAADSDIVKDISALNLSTETAGSKLEQSDDSSFITPDDDASDSRSDEGLSDLDEPLIVPSFRFKIPDETLREAKAAMPETDASFWSVRLYRDGEGRSVPACYIKNAHQAEEIAAEFLNESVLGFDLEWEMFSKPGIHDAKRCVSVLQLAAEHKCAVFHLSMFKEKTAADLLPPSLVKILKSDRIYKVGVNVAGDSQRISKCFDIEMKGCFELSHLYKVVTYGNDEPSLVNKRMVRLALLTEELLGLPMYKGEVRTSSWSERLDARQVNYAASDAYAGLCIFNVLEAKRLELDPMPPRPAFWELDSPLQLANGKMLTSKKRVKQSDAPQDDGEGENDAFYEALEEQNEEGGVSVLSKSVDSKPVKEPEVKIKAERPQSDEVDAANSWTKTWREDDTTKTRKSLGDAQLRAYHLWHMQGMDIETAAAMLRQPPLSTRTVASYLIDTIAHSHLPYDKARLRVAFDIIPQSVHARYRGLLARIQD